jgi:riboflavin synthase
MFTGIVAAVGKIIESKPLGSGNDSGVRLTIQSGGLALNDVQLGDSIAIQGACMTVVEKTTDTFCVDISRESLSKTVGLNGLFEVNLEKALTLAERLGGHLVTGHVDGLGEVVRFEPVGESWLLGIRTPNGLGKYFAYKGSVIVNGVSLTVNNVVDDSQGTVIDINLIPHTIAVTTLKHLTVGVQVNLEIDVIARYCERILSYQSGV